jgi:hypothetical protein
MQCSLVKVSWSFGGTHHLHLAACFMIVACFNYSLILKMDPTFSSKMSVDFHQTTQCYIPENRTLPSHHCKNLKSNFNFSSVTLVSFVVAPPLLNYFLWLLHLFTETHKPHTYGNRQQRQYYLLLLRKWNNNHNWEIEFHYFLTTLSRCPPSIFTQLKSFSNISLNFVFCEALCLHQELFGKWDSDQEKDTDYFKMQYVI